MSEEENKDYLAVSCLVDFLKAEKDVAIRSAAENLSTLWALVEDANPTIPTTVQYTHGVGNIGSLLAQHNHRTALLFDSQEAVDFAVELVTERKSEFTTIIGDPLKLGEGFPASPDGKGWKNVILDDVVQHIEGDLQLVAILRAIYLAMAEDGKLVLRVPQVQKSSWNREYNATVVTESIEKASVRKYKRTLTSHGEIELRHEETLYDFAIGDLHESARAASFRPTRDMGLDPSAWCCYDRV